MVDEPALRFQPTDGLTYNPNRELYWEPRALAAELERSFELCSSCRMCVRYCQSFPTLFEAVDGHGGVCQVPDSIKRHVVEECFQCRLCSIQCPYTEAEGHELKLDFPRLMLRAKAVWRREDGIRLRDRLLADPDRLGRLGSLAPKLANWALTVRPLRALMAALLGVHRAKLLPRFASPTFERWIGQQLAGASETPTGEVPVVLFGTCSVNYNRPALGQAAYRVLAHNRCRIAFPKLACCGMPALETGDLELAQRKARHNVRSLLPYVERGFRVAVVNPTCSLMIRQEYPELLRDPADPELAAAAVRVAGATCDLCEFLFELRKEGLLREDFRSTPGGPVAYHAPCHLRAQNIGFRGRDLMRRIPGVTPRLVAECCGHDGTWAAKKENFELAMKNGARAFQGMRAAEAQVWATDCTLAAVQFEQACGHTALHPVEVLDRAYRDDGFPVLLETEAATEPGWLSGDPRLDRTVE